RWWARCRACQRRRLRTSARRTTSCHRLSAPPGGDRGVQGNADRGKGGAPRLFWAAGSYTPPGSALLRCPGRFTFRDPEPLVGLPPAHVIAGEVLDVTGIGREREREIPGDAAGRAVRWC